MSKLLNDLDLVSIYSQRWIMVGNQEAPFFVTIPHSGEKIPEFCDWLQGLPEEILMCDVDRYVDLLYAPALQNLKVPCVKTDWHRYAADMNRVPEDIDSLSVEGHSNKPGTHNRGFHWQITTLKYQLMKKPMSKKMHQDLVALIYEPFHKAIRNQFEHISGKGFKKIYHIDAHSMPSVGTSEHRDPGEHRADIVVSDCKGKSSESEFVDLVIRSFEQAGFKVGYNWPYLGGRVSEQYGNPSIGHNTIQVELNRSLYMDEKTKKLIPQHLEVQAQLARSLDKIVKSLS